MNERCPFDHPDCETFEQIQKARPDNAELVQIFRTCLECLTQGMEKEAAAELRKQLRTELLAGIARELISNYR